MTLSSVTQKRLGLFSDSMNGPRDTLERFLWSGSEFSSFVPKSLSGYSFVSILPPRFFVSFHNLISFPSPVYGKRKDVLLSLVHVILFILFRSNFTFP